MAPEQDWCLECGAAVTTRVSRSAGPWLAVATILVVLAVVGATAYLILSQASDDADKAAGPAARPAPPPYRGRIPIWPSSTRAYTIIAFATHNRAAAEARARRLITAGQRAGVLRTTGYADFTPGLWLTWSGQYADTATAIKAAGRVRALFPLTRVRLIRKATPPPTQGQTQSTQTQPTQTQTQTGTTSPPASTQPSAQSPAQ